MAGADWIVRTNEAGDAVELDLTLDDGRGITLRMDAPVSKTVARHLAEAALVCDDLQHMADDHVIDEMEHHLHAEQGGAA